MLESFRLPVVLVAVAIGLSACARGPQKFETAQSNALTSETAKAAPASTPAQANATAQPAAAASAKAAPAPAATTATKTTAAAAPAAPPAVANATKYWKKAGGWKLPKENNRKVAIAEFTVEYVLSRDKQLGGNQLGLMTAVRIAGVGKREYAFDDTLKRELPTELYNSFVAALKEYGYEVVEMNTVADAIDEAGMVEGTEGKKKGARYDHGFMSGGGAQKVQIFPVQGLPRLYDGLFSAGKNATAMANVMGDVGADIGMRVHIRVGLHKGQATAEAGSNIAVFTGLSSYEHKGKTIYANKTFGSLAAHNTLYYPKPVVDEGDKNFKAFKGNVWTVDSNDFTEATRAFFPTYARMAVSLIK